MRHTNRGNILFLILLAVVLFAALAYAVTQSMRGGGKDAGSEKTSANVSELLNYFTQLDTAIQRMMMTGGIKEHEINFFNGTNAFATGNYDNVNCTENRCRVFHPDGGGVSGKNFPNYARAGTGGTGVPRIHLFSVTGVGTEAPDLVLNLYGIDFNMCKEINARAGLANDVIYGVPFGSTSTNLLYYHNPYPSGPFPTATGASLSVPQQAGLAGTFCTCGGADYATCVANTFNPMIHHVLIAR